MGECSYPRIEKEESFVDLNNSIRTKYILNSIFSYLDINKKLDLIKYHKKIQKIIEIDIEYYKTMSGRYKEGERNGKGKEYDNFGNLIYEGEYLNDKRNGKGKEYYYGDLVFEGQYKW